MIVAIDAYYQEEEANIAAVCIKDWTTEEIIAVESCRIKNLAPYVPGQFYKRELPGILQVLKQCIQQTISLVIIDGYVVLDDNGKFGLAGHLYEALHKSTPVIGVAKRSFIHNSKHVIPIRRGESDNPLYITSIGIDLQLAALHIQQMKGPYRMPNLLKYVDQQSRVIHWIQ